MKKLILLPLFAIVFACGSKENEKAIKGLQPVDVYMNFEKMGYTTDKSLLGDIKSWTSTNALPGGTLRVETNSSDTNTVEFVRATAMVDVTGDIQNTKDFFKTVASLPFEGSDYKANIKWLNENFNKIEVDTVFNGIKFTLRSPSKMVKTLTLEKK